MKSAERVFTGYIQQPTTNAGVLHYNASNANSRRLQIVLTKRRSRSTDRRVEVIIIVKDLP